MNLSFVALLSLIVACSNEGYTGSAPATPPLKPNKNVAAAPETASQKLFNVAILTQSVQCLFCHMRIEGDVGGIKFPPNNQMESRSGDGLRILGSLYATNEIPSALSNPPQTSSAIPNYKNTELKIFPTTKDASGNIVFPTVTKELIAGKTKGILKVDDQKITDTFTGDLTIVEKGSPIEMDGEVFVDGDVIIGGNYKGVGTIYARNIFIVKDLKATVSPFPFPSDPAAAKEQATKSIQAKNDGLYLFALGQITVGYPDPAFLNNQDWRHSNVGLNQNTKSQPPGNLADYVALRDPSKKCSVFTGLSTIYREVLVNRVDAFLYASDYLLWRTCENFELNGGFVAPNVALANAGDSSASLKFQEPSNVVRYDYRLRAGVKAFSVLKNFFEQE